MDIKNRKNSFENFTYKLQKLMFKESDVHPSIFITFVVLKEVELLEFPESTTTLFFLGLAYLVFTFFNSYFTFTAALTLTLGQFMPFNILMGILGINQKWKLCLFPFLLIYYFPTQLVQLKNILVCISEGSICFSIYKELYFPTYSSNKWYFTLFFTLFFANFYSYLLQHAIQLETNNIHKFMVVPFVAFVGYTVIKIRLEEIHTSNTSLTKHPHILIQRIEIFKENILNDGESINWKVYTHQQTCNKPQSFCTEFDVQSLSVSNTPILEILTKELINRMFLESIENYTKEYDNQAFLIQKYSEFLIDCNQYPRAITILSKIDENRLGYFNKCDNFRIKEKLKYAYQRDIYFDHQQLKMFHFYNYDIKVGYFMKEIREIIIDKVIFWVEVCKESPELKNLEDHGKKIVKRIENLHKYFTLEIKPSEEVLEYFKCTYIYAAYLTLTTNYSELANSLTKKSQKLQEEKKVNIGVEQEFGLFMEIVENKEHFVDHSFELRVKNITRNLSLHLSCEKRTLLNKNVTEIIPNEYQEIHTKYFDRYVKLNDFENRKSTLIGDRLELPFKINNDYVSFLSTESSLRFDHTTNSIIVQTLLKKVSNDCINFIMNLEGKLIYRENEMFKHFAELPVVKSEMENIQSEYQSNRNLKKKNVKSEDDEYLVTFSFEPLFCTHLTEPLIKIVAKSDIFKSEKHRLETYGNTNKVKELQSSVISEQENDSQASNSSRKDSIESVLTVLSESNSIKVEPFLVLTLLAFAIVVTICIFLMKDSYKMWLAKEYEGLPSFTLICLVNMKNTFNTVIGWRYDSVRKFEDEPSMNKLMSSLYDGKTVYEVRAAKFQSLFKMQSNVINNFILGSNNEISQELKQLFERTITMESKENNVTAKNMTMQSIIYNFLVGIYHIESGYYFPKLILSFGYLPIFYNEISLIIQNLLTKLREKFEDRRKDNIVMISLISFSFAIFMIPIWRFNVHNKKKYEKIYNLFVLIESKIIVTEILKLETLEKEFFLYSNFDKSPESTQQVTSLFGIRPGTKKPAFKSNSDNLLFTPLQPRASKKEEILRPFSESFSYLNSIKIRKRSGDLLIEKSGIASKNLIIWDYFPSTFIIIFIAILMLTFVNKYKFLTGVITQFEENYLMMEKAENTSLALLLTKIYVDEYEQNEKIKFVGQDLEEWLTKYISGYRYNYEAFASIETDRKSCDKNILMCQMSYSNLLRENLIHKSISHAFEYKKAYLENSSSENKINVEKSRFQLIFAQQLLDENSKDYYSHFYSSFEALEEARYYFKIREKNIFIIFWLLFGIFMAFSLLYTMYVKERYVKEVSLLSVLNKEMLWNNKSVQSFVQMLSKSLR